MILSGLILEVKEDKNKFKTKERKDILGSKTVVMKLDTRGVHWVGREMRVGLERKKKREREDREEERVRKIDEGMWGLQPHFCICQRKLMHMPMHVCLPD